jgi:carbon monoxide dehydrogenase subunit G
VVVLERSVLINRPIEDVFQFVADFENYPRWNHSMLECKRTSESPTNLGTIFESKMVYMRQTYLANLEITEYEPNVKITFYTDKFGFFKWFRGIFTFKKISDTTEFKVNAEADLVGLFKPMGIIIPIIGIRSWGKHLSELKRILETEVYKTHEIIL